VSRLRRKKQTDDLLAEIPEKYRKFFKIHSRLRSAESRHVAVIDHHLYEQCLVDLRDDASIKSETRILLLLIISAGLRITEALSLQRCSFEVDGEHLYFYTKVLKKREPIERKSVVHPMVASAVKAHLLKFRAFDKIFCLNRHQSLYAVKSVFGKTLDLHALRHSHISYLLFYKKFTLEEIQEIMQLNVETIRFYSHLDTTPLLRELYKPLKGEKAS
jgi:integrase